jgi:hypothetical protein
MQRRATPPHPLPSGGIKVVVIEMLPAAISESPFIGEACPTPAVNDFRVGAWLGRIAFISGGQKSEEGVSALEKRLGPFLRRWRCTGPRGSGVIAEGLPQQRDTLKRFLTYPRDLGPTTDTGHSKSVATDVHYEQSDVWCSTCCVSVAYSIVVGPVLP